MLFYHFKVHMSCQIWATKLEVLVRKVHLCTPPVNAWLPGLKQSWKMAFFFTKKQQRFPSPEDLVIDHFTVVCSVAWPWDGSGAGVDLVLVQTSLYLLCKTSCSDAN